MYKLILALGFIMAATGLQAQMSVRTIPATNYTSTHTVVSVSSHTRSSLTVSWEMVEVDFYNVDNDTDCYVRIDGSTTSVAAVGIPIIARDKAGLPVHLFPPSGVFYLQMPAGIAGSYNIRATVIRRAN